MSPDKVLILLKYETGKNYFGGTAPFFDNYNATFCRFFTSKRTFNRYFEWKVHTLPKNMQHKRVKMSQRKKHKLLSFLVVLITVAQYEIFAKPSLLRKLTKFKQEKLEFCTMTLIAIANIFFDKLGKYTMEAKRLRALGLKIFKTQNKANPLFIAEIFYRT